MADRDITISIRGKNEVGPAFDAVRKALLGLDDQTKKTDQSSVSLSGAFKAAGAALAGYFTAQGISSAIRGFVDLTGHLTDLSAKTGIGVEALQRLKYAAEQNGGSLDQVTGAISKLGANLAGGSQSAVGALGALHLSFDSIRNMAPDKAFTTIADAIAKVPDPMAQSKLAMDLFGKSGAELLPMMKGHLSETADAADRLGIVLSEQAVAAGDEFGDTLGALGSVGQSLIAQVLEPMIPTLTTLAKWLGETLPGAVKFMSDALQIGLGHAWLEAKLSFNQFLLSIAEGINAIPLLGKHLGFSASTIAGLRNDVDNAKDSLDHFDRKSVEVEKTQDKAARTMKTLNLEYTNTKKVIEDVDPAIQRLTKSLEDQIDKYEKLRHSISGVAPVYEGFKLARAELVIGAPIQAKATLEWAKMRAEQERLVAEMGVTLAPSIKAVSTTMLESNDVTRGWGKTLGDTLLQIPQLVQNAFTGGGGLGGALQGLTSVFGSAGIGKIFEKDGLIGKQLGGLTKLFGDAFVPGLGSAIGSLVGPLVGKIAGLFSDKNAAEVRKYNAEIDKVRGNLVEMYGPLDQLEAKANAVGLSFTENWGHQGVDGLRAMNTLTAEFKRRWDDLNTSLSTARGELDGVMKHAADLGYVFDDTGKLVGVTFEKMSGLAQQYGIDIGGLGEKFQSQRLHAGAEQIINDFTLLTKGGADVGGVLHGMKDEIGHLVSDSIKFKTTIPENMKPWIQELMRTNQLVDDNGVAITDVSQIKFGDPVATEFEKISNKIEELIGKIGEMVDRINQSLTPAIDQATRDRTMRIGWHVDDPPEILGGAGGSFHVERGYADGTFDAHGVDFPDFGSGTRVIVHNREAIVPYEDRVPTARRWLQGAGGGQGAATNVSVNVAIAIDENLRARLLDDRMIRGMIRGKVQELLYSGLLDVPQQCVSGRSR